MRRCAYILTFLVTAAVAAAMPQIERPAAPAERVAATQPHAPVRAWYRLELDGIAAETLAALSPSPLRDLPLFLSPSANTVLYHASAARAQEVVAFAAAVDAAPQVETLQLSYLTADQVLAALPPATRSGTVTRTADSATLYLCGTAAERLRLREAIGAVDRPPVQIRYQVLVVQRQVSDGLAWSMSAENRSTDSGSRTRLLAGVGSLLALNFDILSVFGYEFAIDLNAELSRNRARVLADTTLTGLRGERVSLENTDTYRYRDLEVDPATGEPAPTGTTREITSGLVIHIQGVPVGADEVDLAVEVRVSKRGSDSGSSTNNPPPTSEKIVQTVLRARCGEPAVIGALAQRDRGTAVKGVPILARIPLLGLLFQHRRSSAEEVLLAVYIVPFRSDVTAATPAVPTAAEIVSRLPAGAGR
jgi:general secretion pathway protein D